jgi:hypothetical protein
MEGEDDRFVGGEQRVEFEVREAMRVLAGRGCVVDDIDLPELARSVTAQEFDGPRSRGSAHRRSTPSPRRVRCHGRCWPTPNPCPAVQCDRRVHRQPLRGRPRAGSSAHVRPRRQVGNRSRQLASGGRWRGTLSLLTDDVVDKAGVRWLALWSAPDVAGQQVVQRADWPPPRNVIGTFSHGRMVEH